MNSEHTPDDSQQVKVPQFNEEIHEQVQEKGFEINLSKKVHDDMDLSLEPQEIQQDNTIKEITLDKDQEGKVSISEEPQETFRPEVKKPSPMPSTLIPIRSSRKRILYIGIFMAVVVVSLTLGLYFGLRRRDEPAPRITFMDSLKDPNQPLFIRQWNEGAQEIYYVNMTYDMQMGSAEAPEQQTSQALYMFSATTMKVVENKTLINAFVMPISSMDFKFDPNKIKNIHSITEASAVEDQNNLVWCWILSTGLIESCMKPTYLNRSDYELTLSFIDQYSPRLEKSYYNNPERRERRRLQEQTEPVVGFDDIHENRDYTFDVDEDEGKVTLGNNYENNNVSYSDQKTNDKSSMSTNSAAKLDGDTGQMTNSLQGGSFSCEADKTKGQTLLEVFKSNVKSSMDLKTYHRSADARYLKFLNKMNEVIDFMEILNPMTNRTVLDEELSEDEKPTTDPEEPEEEDEEDGSRRLQSGRRSIIKIDEAIFETSLIGLPVNARVQANCYDDDECDIKLKARLLFVSVTITAITVPFEAASIANSYRFIKLKVIDNVNNAMVLVTDTVDVLDKTILGSINEVETYAKTIIRPFNSAKSKFQNIMDTFNKKIVEMGTFIPEMTGFIKVQQQEIVSSLEDRFNSLVIDLDLIVSKMDRTFTRIQNITSTVQLDAQIKDQVSTYLTSSMQKLDSFVQEKNAELLQTKKGFEAIVDNVNEKIDKIHLDPQILAKFPEAASLLKIATMFKGYFTTISGTYLKSMNNFYDNFIIRYGAQFERLQKGLSSTEKSVQSQFQLGSGTLPAITAELKNEITKLINSSDLKNLLLDQIYVYEIDLAQYEQDITSIIQKGVEKFYLGIKTTLANGSAFFTNLYQEIKTDVEATSSELQYHNFAALISRIQANVQADYNKLKTDFTRLLDSVSAVTMGNYIPSTDTVKGERKSLDLVNAVKDIVSTFNNLKNVVQTFDKIKNFNLNAFNPLKDVKTNIVSTITEIKTTYTKAVGTIQQMAQEFQMSFPAPNVNFDILQVTFQDLPTKFKDSLFQTLKAQVIDKAKDTGYLQNMFSFQNILDGKLASLIPKIERVLEDIDAFGINKATPKICIPTPLGPICFDGQFNLALGVKILCGFGNGEIYFSVIPYGGADLGIYAYLNWGIIHAGGYVKGIFFEGRLPATVGFAFLNKLELRASLQLILNPFAIEAGAAIRHITIDIHFCCSISFGMSDWIILGRIRTESTPIIINIWDKKLALK